MMKLRKGTFLLCSLLTGCVCSSAPSHLVWPQNAPTVLASEDVEKNLSVAPNRKIRLYARVLGFVSTAFKRAGIFGWKDLGFRVQATGWVRRTVVSTDRYLTIDLELATLKLDGQPLSLVGQRFLRSEVCLKKLNIPRDQRPKVGRQVRISGRLMWDSDGWLEVHPGVPEDIEILDDSDVLPTPRGSTVALSWEG